MEATYLPRQENYGLMKKLADKAARKFSGIVVGEVTYSDLPGVSIVQALNPFARHVVKKTFLNRFNAAIDSIYDPTQEAYDKALKVYRGNPRSALVMESRVRDDHEQKTLDLERQILTVVASAEGKTVDTLLANTDKDAIATLSSEHLALQIGFTKQPMYVPGGLIGDAIQRYVGDYLEQLRRIDREATTKMHRLLLEKTGVKTA